MRQVVVTVEEDGGLKARYMYDGTKWCDEDGNSAPLLASALDNLLTVVAFQSPFSDEE